MSYLKQYVEALSIVILPEQKTIIVRPDSTFIYISPALLKENRFNDKNILNTEQATYSDIPSIAQIAPKCTLEDIECLKTQLVQQYITSQNHFGEIKIYLKQKTPIIDLVTKNTVGIRIDFFPIYSLGRFKSYIHDHITKANKTHQDASLKRKNIELTETEELILFLLIMYNKPKVITTHLNQILNKNTATSTVRNIIHQQLLRKFEVVSIEELIDKSIFLGYDEILPRIMSTQFSIRIL